MRYTSLSLFALLIALACSKPTTIGVGFLEDDEIGVGIQDTFTVIAETILSDSVRVYEIGNQFLISRYLCGLLDDPLLGQTEASIYSQVQSNSEPTITEGATIDSILLTLAYDTSGFYGIDTSDLYSLEVYRVVEDMVAVDDAFIGTTFETGERIGGVENFVVDANNARLILETPITGSGPDSITYSPHVRIPLNNSLGQELLDLDTSITWVSDLPDIWNGLHIKASGDGDGVLAFDMESIISRVSIYFKNDSVPRRFDLDISNLVKRSTHVVHNRVGSDLEDFIDDPAKGDSLIFLQSAGGTRARFTFPHIPSLASKLVVNKAELILTVANLPDDDRERFSPLKQLITFIENSDNNLQLISDVYFINVNEISPISGGTLIEDSDSGTMQYRINLTDHMQQMKEGLVGTDIIVETHLNAENPGRSILYGPQNSMFPARLEIVYSENP